MENENIVEEYIKEEDAKMEENATKPKRTRKVATKTEGNGLGESTGSKTWKEVFIANYEGKSEEAKALEPFLKTTYKGDVYIPWAVMERLVLMCDEDAKFTNILNARGGLVHSDMLVQHQSNIQKGEVISETEAPMFAHFVKVSLEFMGKIFIEDYPVQEQDYSAAKVFNQNLVNRALQRAKAKLGARATGLGLKLYEGFDLQFDTKEEEKKPELPKMEAPAVKEEPVKETKPAEEVKQIPVEKVELTEEQKVANIMDGGVTEAYLNGERTFTTQDVKVEAPVAKSNISDEVMSVVNLIKNTEPEKMAKVLQMVNVSIIKKYKFALSQDDSVEELAEKIGKFPNVPQFEKTLLNFIN